MKELLLSYAYLMDIDFLPMQEYTELLDQMFLEDPEDALLLDLEWASSHKDTTTNIIRWHIVRHPVDPHTFGRFLLQGLKRAYERFGPDIEGFGDRAYALWNILPTEIQYEEPYETLMYADDPLSWGDEEQTRRLYEEMFHYFNR